MEQLLVAHISMQATANPINAHSMMTNARRSVLLL